MPKENPAPATARKPRNGSALSLHDSCEQRTPSRFKRTPKTQTGRARRALAPNGPGARLVSALGGHAYLFTLRPADIGLSDRYSAPSTLYSRALDDVFAALERTFSGPFYAVCEIGDGSNHERGTLHIHVIGHRNDGPPNIPRGGERCKPIYNAFGAYRYLGKPAEQYSLEAHLDHAAARVVNPSGKSPRSRRHFLGTRRIAWAAEANDLYDLTRSATPPPTPS